MSAPQLVAQHYHDQGHKDPTGQARLDYDGCFLRRKVLTLVDGRTLLVDLAQTTSLDHGGVLILEDGGEVVLEAALTGHGCTHSHDRGHSHAHRHAAVDPDAMTVTGVSGRGLCLFARARKSDAGWRRHGCGNF